MQTRAISADARVHLHGFLQEEETTAAEDVDDSQAAAAATKTEEEKGGKNAEGGEEKRIAPDGVPYSHAQFVEFYGGSAEWDAAAPAAAAEEEVGEPLSVPGPDYPGGGWVQQEDERGESYFYNTRTGARQTERPEEDQIDRS